MTSVAEAPSLNTRAFTIERQGDLAILWFDLPGEKVNKFSSAVLLELSGVLDELAGSPQLTKVVFASRKPGIFIAGADVTEFTTVTGIDQAKQYVLLGQQVFTKVAKLPQTTVAAIDGACLGGGCELALSCDWRVISDSPRAQIGLPEVKLGIFPAWGGTSKLPRLIGLPGALDIILNGKVLDGKRAKKAGLVDDVVESGIVLEIAKKYAEKGKRKVPGRTKFYIEGNPLARNLIFSKARKAVLGQTHGHYPAPLKAIEVMEYAMSAGVERGMQREAEEAAALVNNDVAQNLVRLFFLMEESKKDPYTIKPADVSYVGVLGAGIMGGGIAQIVADKTDADVRMRDIAMKAIGGGMKAAAKVWKKKVDRRRMTRGEMARKLARITGTTDWSGFSRADVVIEAVVENLAIKRQVLAEFEALAKPGAIFATNTSTIPITQIAAESKRPELVVGMHFFNPVDRMPLVEIIRGEKTSEQAMVTTAALARKLGKTVVYCNDGPGFVVNRILGPYMNESGFLLQEGNTIESLDKAMVDFGMPMGPMALLDEVGIDVAAKVAGILTEAFGARMEKSTVVEKLYAEGRHGKKNGKGLYLYENGRRKGPDATVYKTLGIRSPHPADTKAVVERMLLAMINEASLILDEKIVASAGELDLAMIMGTGFPPFRGGLLRYADSLGLPYVVSRLDALSSLGPRFRPNEPLKRLAERDAKFYQTYVLFPGATTIRPRMSSRERTIVIAVALVCAATRFLAFARSLWEWDEALLVLGMRDYDVTVHHPHPPGFPVYIALGKLLRLVIDSDFRALQAINVVASILVFPAVYFFARQLGFRFSIAVMAGALFASFPNVWFFGGTAFSDIPSVVLVLFAVTYLLRGAESRNAYWLGTSLLALAIGIRPQNILVGLIPGIYATFRRRSYEIAVALLIGLLVVGAAFGGAIYATGSFESFAGAIRGHGEYISNVDSWRNPDRPPMWRLLDRFFVKQYQSPLLGVIATIFVIVSAVGSWRERSRPMLFNVLAFLPFALFAWAMLDRHSVSRFSIAYQPMFALLVADGLQRTGRKYAPILAAALVTGFAVYTIPALTPVRNEVAPSIQAASAVRQMVDPRRARLYVGHTMSKFVDLMAPGFPYTRIVDDRVLPLSTMRPAWVLAELTKGGEGGFVFRRERGNLWNIARRHYFGIKLQPLEQHARFVSGWYPAETTYIWEWRWMGARSVTLLPPAGEQTLLRIHLSPANELANQSPTITIKLNGVVLDQLRISGDFNRDYRVKAAPNGMPNVLELSTDKTVTPPQDTRVLGLKLRELGWGQA